MKKNLTVMENSVTESPDVVSVVNEKDTEKSLAVKFYTEYEAAGKMCISKDVLEEMRKDGRVFHKKFGKKCILYDADDISNTIAFNQVSPNK